MYPFDYHCGKEFTAPLREKRSRNIKGIELEISDYGAEEYLSTLVDEYIIYDAETAYEVNETNVDAVVENDGSVAWEVILRADTMKPIFQKIKKINTELNPNTVNNESGTSAHIHLNREYCHNQGIHSIDIQKAAEWLAYPMFLFSGRTREKMNNWARSILPCELEDDLLTRATLVDRMECSYNRYNIMNLNNSKTYELRIFSNKCNFDYKTLRFYWEFSDMLMDLASNMVGKSYKEHLDECIEFVDDFMLSKPRRRKFYNKYGMDSIFLDSEQLNHIALLKQFDRIDARIKQFERIINGDHHREEIAMSYLRMTRDINSQEGMNVGMSFNPARCDFEELAEIARQITRNNLDL